MVPGVADMQFVLGRGATEVSALGASVTLSDGRSMLDFGSYGITLLGHRPAPVVRAAVNALDRMPTSTRLLPHPDVSRLADELTARLDSDHLTRVWIGSTGSDAVELALRLAMAATGQTRVIAVDGAFHGGAVGVSMSADRHLSDPVALMRDVEHVPLDETAVARALAAAPAAALIFEPLQSEHGGRPLPPSLLSRWTRDAHAAGAFVIADELEVGLHRCRVFSVTLAGAIKPDAVLLGRPLGGGVMPISAGVFTNELFSPFFEDPYFYPSTLSGHPLACSVGVAAIGLIDDLAPRGALIERRLADLLGDGQRHHPELVQSTSAVGAFGTIGCVSHEAAQLLLVHCAREGLLLCPCLGARRALRVLPPLVATERELDRAAEILVAGLDAVERRAGR
jgi:putrescine aminotransferase